MTVYFQHWTGDIRYIQLTPDGQWIGGGASEVIASDAKNATPISAVAYSLNDTSVVSPPFNRSESSFFSFSLANKLIPISVAHLLHFQRQPRPPNGKHQPHQHLARRPPQQAQPNRLLGAERRPASMLVRQLLRRL